jgi:hypothetical protein
MIGNKNNKINNLEVIAMTEEYRKYITEENKYYDLLKSNPRFKPQGRTKDFKKVVVGIIRGKLEEYHPCDFLDFEYFDTWKDAYIQLSNNKLYARIADDGKCIQTVKIHLLGIGKYSFQTSLFGKKPYENNINMPVFDKKEDAENWIENDGRWTVMQ